MRLKDLPRVLLLVRVGSQNSNQVICHLGLHTGLSLARTIAVASPCFPTPSHPPGYHRNDLSNIPTAWLAFPRPCMLSSHIFPASFSGASLPAHSRSHHSPFRLCVSILQCLAHAVFIPFSKEQMKTHLLHEASPSSPGRSNSSTLHSHTTCLKSLLWSPAYSVSQFFKIPG